MNATLTLVLLFILSVISLNEAKSPPLLTYTVDTGNISISGLSSGAYFTVQFHVAFSRTIMGAGVMAGGPYYCTEGKVDNASLAKCTQQPEKIDIKVLVDKAKSAAKSGYIDDPLNLMYQNVFLFSGTKDTVVVPGVVKKVEEFYNSFQAYVKTEFTMPAQHSIVTDDYGNSCDYLGTPYINNCDYSTPYHILTHIYGWDKVTAANTTASKSENLFTFDQSEFFSSDRTSLDDTGFIYVPSACQTKLFGCRLHVAFHGCHQGRYFLGSEYALHSEYNGLAERNNIIILYPQITKVEENPEGCWDLGGYTDPTTYVYQDGLQPAAVMNMIKRVSGLK